MKKKMAFNMDALLAEVCMSTEDDKINKRGMVVSELPFYKTGMKSTYIKN
jgi:hypothetical protein